LLSLIASLLGFLSAGSLSNAQSPDQVKYDSSAPSITCLYGYSANSYGSCSKNYSYTPRTIAPYKAPTFNYTPQTIAPYKAPTFNYTPQTIAPYKAPSYSMNSPSAICRDGTYSYSQNRSGTCSWHGGVSSWLR